VAGGIHAAELGATPDGRFDAGALAALCERHGVWPTYAIGRMV